MVKAEVHFYGERGLVNAILLDLNDAGRLLDLIGLIDFHARTPRRIDCRGLTQLTVVIEAGFGGFGWPDALLVATGPGRREILFLEAKATTYELAAADFTAQKRQFTSKINGQFSLKYRLVEALSHYTRGSGTLEESANLARAYGERRARHLVKADNLLNVVDRYLAGATADQCSFVALTDDTQNPWPVVAARRQTLLPFLCKPLAGSAPATEWAEARNTWDRHAERFGWIGFQTIEEQLPLGHRYNLAKHFLEAERGRNRKPRDSRRHLHLSPATEEVVGVSAADAQPPRTAARSGEGTPGEDAVQV